MAITIQKNTVDISSNVDLKSIEFKSVLTKEVGSLKFGIKNYPGKTTCALGDQVDLYEGVDHIFGGTITDIKDDVIGGILIGTTYSANDWTFRLNAKMVVKSYDSMDPHDIVLDIIANFTDGTFTTTNVQTAGFDVSSIRFNYEPVAAALEKLANQIGWQWYVDADKDIHFFPPTAIVSAPYTIDDTSGNLEWNSLKIDQNLVNMKNSVFVIGGTYIRTFDASNTPDVYLTNGTQTVFPIAYPYTFDTIVVTLAGVSQTIGVDQVDDDGSFDVMYNEVGRFIRFTSTPTTGQEIKVYGDAQIPILAQVRNEAAIAAFGEIQDAIIDQQIKSIAEAQARGLAEISRYGEPIYVIKFSTLRTGFRVGQTVQVDSDLFGEDVLVIIKRIVGKMENTTEMRYEMECVGTEQVNFIDLMKFLLLQNASQTIIGDSTVLQVLLLINESITLADTLNAPTTDSPPYVYGPDAGNVGVWNFATWS